MGVVASVFGSSQGARGSILSYYLPHTGVDALTYMNWPVAPAGLTAPQS
jgi:hypothetical protein